MILAHMGTEQLCKYFAFIGQIMQMNKRPLGKALGREAMPAQGSQGWWSLLYRGRAFAPPEGLVR